MREKLFRGKRVQGNYWVGGYFYKSDVLKRERESAKATLIFTPNIDTFIYLPEEKNSVMVIPETVGQYTGLTDKNGTKIFEGDIVSCTDNNNQLNFTAVVEFGNPNCTYDWGYQLKHIQGDKPNMDILMWVEVEETGAICEVIGNIHDNPELLKGGTK